MLKLEHVTFRYERRGAPVLRDASLSLETGQVGVLLGRNGCGKTTLLKTTLGLCTPEQGQILFDGQALGAMKRQQRAQVAAYVPQELQFGALRVYDAVLAGRVSRFGIQPGAADRTAAEAALADMDLTALAERNVQTLSGGESFQASLCLALGLSDIVQAHAGGIEFDTMFVDEGFGSLDEESLAQAMESLAGLADGNRLVGIISHVPELKQRIEKQILVRKDRSGGSFVEVRGE